MNSGELLHHLKMGCIPLCIEKTPGRIQWISISLPLGTLAMGKTAFVVQLVVIDNCLLIVVQCSRSRGRLCGCK